MTFTSQGCLFSFSKPFRLREMACYSLILQVKLFVGNAAKYIYQDDALQIPGRFPNDEVCIIH